MLIFNKYIKFFTLYCALIVKPQFTRTKLLTNDDAIRNSEVTVNCIYKSQKFPVYQIYTMLTMLQILCTSFIIIIN